MRYVVVLQGTGFLGPDRYIVLQDHTVSIYRGEIPLDARLFVSERSAAKYAMKYRGGALFSPTGSFQVLHVHWLEGPMIRCGSCGKLMDERWESICSQCKIIDTEEIMVKVLKYLRESKGGETS